MELRITLTDENSDLFYKAYILATMIAAYTNNHLFFDIRDMPEAERQAEIKTLKSMMEELAH